MTTLRISTNRAELDVGMIHRYLSQESYWAKGLPRAVLEKCLAHSLCFGGYLQGQQVAFARVITDYATSAHLKDVFVLPECQRHGYGKAMVRAVISHPELQGVTFTLGTDDAHGLYERFGFALYPTPERSMIRLGNYLHADT